jgi:hypothetical protein
MHLWIKCPTTSQLFQRLEIELEVPPFNAVERSIGMDTNIDRSKPCLKRLNILRHTIHIFNTKNITPSWYHFVGQLEKVYNIEYAIAEKRGKTLLHLRLWGLNKQGDSILMPLSDENED